VILNKEADKWVFFSPLDI